MNASRFLYEACLLLARDTALAIAKGRRPYYPLPSTRTLMANTNGEHRSHLSRHIDMTVDIVEMIKAGSAT